jgi:hypothetical protein
LAVHRIMLSVFLTACRDFGQLLATVLVQVPVMAFASPLESAPMLRIDSARSIRPTSPRLPNPVQCQWLLQRKQLLLVTDARPAASAISPGLHSFSAEQGSLIAALCLVPALAAFRQHALEDIGAASGVACVAGVLVAIFGVTVAELKAIWLILLAGIVGGRVFLFSQRRTKIFYLSRADLPDRDAAVPGDARRSCRASSMSNPWYLSLARYGAPVLIAAMALLPEEPGRKRSRTKRSIWSTACSSCSCWQCWYWAVQP